MRRKLVKQGPSSLTVSLPSQWIKANNLQGGQEVLLLLDHNKVLISADEQQEQEQSILIDVRTLSNTTIGLLLSAVHKKGFEEVRLRIEGKQLAYIEHKVSSLLGYEIVQHAGDVIVIRFVAKLDNEELPVLIRRTFLVTLSLAEEVINNKNAKELLVLETTNNRLTNYCELILVKKATHDKNAMFQYIIVWLLEKIADQYKDAIIANAVQVEDAKLCFSVLKQFYDLYYKYSYERHNEFLVELEHVTATLTKRNSALVAVPITLAHTGGSIIALNLP